MYHFNFEYFELSFAKISLKIYRNINFSLEFYIFHLKTILNYLYFQDILYYFKLLLKIETVAH